MKSFIEAVTRKPRITIAVLVLLYLGSIRLWGLEPSVFFVMLVAGLATVMITWKGRQ